MLDLYFKKHDTTSVSCGDLFGNAKLLWICLLMTKFVVAYLIKSFFIAVLSVNSDDTSLAGVGAGTELGKILVNE